VARLPRQVSYNQRGDAARYATEVLTSSISAGAAVLTAVAALVLNHRSFTTITNRITALESTTSARFIALENLVRRLESIESDLKEFFRVQAAGHDKRIEHLDDKQ
jgi:hypothetical protein